MVKIEKVIVESLENAGCNNGNYPNYTVLFINEDTKRVEKFEGMTCRCGNGCSETDRLPREGMEFYNMKEYEMWLYDDFMIESK